MASTQQNDPEVAETEFKLGEKDVRRVVRILGEVAALSGDQTVKRRALMDALAKFVDADAWLWTMTRLDPKDSTPVSMGVIHDGLSPEQLTAWLESSQINNPPLPEHAPLTELTQAGRHFTRNRQDLVADDAWYGNPTVQRYRLEVGFDHFLYTIYPLEPGVISAIGLYRRTDREPFNERDRKLAHIVTSEIPWLHTAGLPQDRGLTVPKLSKRLRSVLILLLEGKGRKDVARLLTISPHTAHDHIAKIYEHFDVSSQIELIQRFTRGDGGDAAR